MRKWGSWVWWLLIAIGATLDQVSKFLILQNLRFSETVSLIPSLNFTLSYNRGIAFGWFYTSQTLGQWILISISVLITVGLSIWLYRTPKHWPLQALGLSCIVGGAIGNLIDRCLRGYVVDFIDFYIAQWHFHTFNIADAFICVGAATLIVSTFIYHQENEHEDITS